MISRKTSDVAGLFPEAVEILRSDFHMPLYCRELKLRHPLAIYIVSLRSVIDDFGEVLDEFDRLMAEKSFLGITADPPVWNVDLRLLKRQRQLLYSLMEHLDDCYSILKCFFPIPKDRGDYKRIPEIKACMDAVSDYWKFVSGIVNYNKHSQGRLRLMVVFDDTHAIPGYFIESVNFDPMENKDYLGPLPDIHKNGDTAFSFARDLRYHFVHLYIVSHELSIAVNNIVGANISPFVRDNGMNDLIHNVAKRIECLPRYFFKDETRLPVPWVTVQDQNSGNVELTLTYPDNNILLVSPPLDQKLKAIVAYEGDEYSTSMKMPYALL